jgi:hypothetical protein
MPPMVPITDLLLHARGGRVNLDVVNGRILYVEVVDRPPLAAAESMAEYLRSC